ncbi:MAG: 50S ribosomal protein L17 [Planctomycetales bacterium]|nr:50S ribosomal protein L17 [Planctomycetales bacterium]
MRHRKRGRHLGRSSSHRKALLKNMASALILTERDAELDDNKPKVKGRIITTLQKAKEVRPLVEKCITIARKAQSHIDAANALRTDADRRSDEFKKWRQSEEWAKWNAAVAPAVAARRRALKLLGDKQAVSILFNELGPRFLDRNGGYTRILKLAKPRLGDAGDRAILEFVGVRDRGAKAAPKPAFETEAAAAE